MKKISSIFLFLFLLSGFALAADIPEMFPFPSESYTLPNGMEVVLIKYGSDGTVIDMLVVDTGSRYEKKPDEIEYTHLMEHLMFRGSKNYTVADVNKIYTKYGVYDQGFTASDFTCYYRIFPKDAMEDLTKIMADRLENLSFTEDEYKAETGAVLGEYQGHYQTPWSRLHQKLYQIAFTIHPYRDVPEHLEVLKKMPENLEAVMNFYRNYYKPNNCRLVITGDFDTAHVKEIIEKYYGPLKASNVKPDIEQEPLQTGEITGEVKYDGETSPYLLIAYKIPGYDVNNGEIPSIDLIKELYFTDSSPLYKRLVYDEKLVYYVSFPGYYFCKDPSLFTTTMKLKKAEDMEKVKEIFFEETDKIRKNLCTNEELDRIREKNRYDILTGMDSLEKTGFTFTNYYFLSGDPDGVNKYFKHYFSITPEDIKNTAEKYFIEKNRTVVTLYGKEEQKNEE